MAANNNRVHMPWSLYYCLIAHISFVVNRAFSTMPAKGLQKHPLLFTTNHTDRTFFSWRFHTARPSHLGHSTILLWPKRMSRVCTKLRTAAASNNRVNMPWSLHYYLFIPHICSVVLRAHSVRGEPHIQHKWRGCNTSMPYSITFASRSKKNYVTEA